MSVVSCWASSSSSPLFLIPTISALLFTPLPPPWSRLHPYFPLWSLLGGALLYQCSTDGCDILAQWNLPSGRRRAVSSKKTTTSVHHGGSSSLQEADDDTSSSSLQKQQPRCQSMPRPQLGRSYTTSRRLRSRLLTLRCCSLVVALPPPHRRAGRCGAFPTRAGRVHRI